MSDDKIPESLSQMLKLLVPGKILVLTTKHKTELQNAMEYYSGIQATTNHLSIACDLIAFTPTTTGGRGQLVTSTASSYVVHAPVKLTSRDAEIGIILNCNPTSVYHGYTAAGFNIPGIWSYN